MGKEKSINKAELYTGSPEIKLSKTHDNKYKIAFELTKDKGKLEISIAGNDITITKGSVEEYTIEERALFFTHVMKEQRSRGYAHGGDFKTATIIGTKGDLKNFFTATNMEVNEESGYHKVCGEREAVRAVVATIAKESGGSISLGDTGVNELHLIAGNGRDKKSHYYPCGLCYDILKKLPDDMKFVIYPSALINGDIDVEIGNSLEDAKDNQILVLTKRDVIPYPEITMIGEVVSVSSQASSKLVRGGSIEVKNENLEIATKASKLLREKGIDISIPESLPTKPSKKDINDFMVKKISETYKIRATPENDGNRSLDPVEKIRVAVLKLDNGEYVHAVESIGKNDKAMPDAISLAVASIQAEKGKVREINVMEFSQKNINNGKISVPFEGMERALKNSSPDGIDISFTAFNKGGLEEKDITQISDSGSIDRFYPSMFKGVQDKGKPDISCACK